MISLGRWQRWGLYSGLFFLVIHLSTFLFPGVEFWLEGTIWQLAFGVVYYPGAWVTTVIFPEIGVRDIYDVPVPCQTTFKETVQEGVIGFAWWFVLGALASVLFARLRRRRLHADGQQLS